MASIETPPTTTATLLLRSITTSVFTVVDKSLLDYSDKYKLFQLLRYLIVSTFLFFLRFLPKFNSDTCEYYPIKLIPKKENASYLQSSGGGEGGCDSGIGRALSQLLAILTDIPASSRKYEVVRSLAETLIDDNNSENTEALSQVNRVVLVAAFERTICQLEAALREKGANPVENTDGDGGSREGLGQRRLNRVLKAVRYVGEEAWARVAMGKGSGNRSGISAEKLAAELLWLAEKLAACGFGEDAVCRFASAWNLARLSLSAEPRVQGSLVKVSGNQVDHPCPYFFHCII